ncbi:AraC-like DNA-binding protein [Dysgonomonas hofstadii]|uniref:AraC-like DNA-binding protein n=1 Tax=Dysgonomonas hofstadii TaxID=637886 RepID=A0A840CN09_9BACT|nr:AraC family transcriptional regulator [Dysgonomonas hofstadii]MBB4037467.1 AraC-like DNA-binding protein [Dysgonomonas hofstadii]
MIIRPPTVDQVSNEYENSLQDYILPLEKDDSFKVHYLTGDKEFMMGIPGENSIVFIMKGKILIQKDDSDYMMFSTNNMFFISKAFGPYKSITKESSIYIELKSDNLLPFIDQVLLNRIVSLYAPDAIELNKLQIKKTLRYFLSGIIYYRRNKIFSKYVYDIKKKEFVFLMRTLYDKQTLAGFFSPVLLSQNHFRMDVLANYTHDSTVKSLSKKCFMTTKTFTRKFKAEFGMTPHKWIVNQKVKSLEYYLVHKTVSVDNILTEFHFSSMTEFLHFCDKYNLKAKLLGK